MKARLCLEKLQDSSESSEQLAEVNKATHSSNKIDYERDEPSKQGLRQKKVAFSDSEDNFIRKGISKYGYGRWTSILNDPSFKFHPSRKPCTLAVRVKKKCDSAAKDNFDNFIIMSQTISFNKFFELLFLGHDWLCWKLKAIRFSQYLLLDSSLEHY